MITPDSRDRNWLLKYLPTIQFSDGNYESVASAVNRALREGLQDRNFAAAADTFVAPASWVTEPLSLKWSTVVEPYRYGGIRFYGDGGIYCDSAEEVLAGFPGPTLSEHLENRLTDAGFRSSVIISRQTVGDLLDPEGSYREWVVSDESRIEEATSEFFAMVDGPLRYWARQRCDVDTLLRTQSAPGASEAANASYVRSMCVLSLITDHPETARQLIRGYPVNIRVDSAERITAFERELADRFPEYGPLQLS